MNRLVLIITIPLLIASLAHAGWLEVTKRAGEYKVDIFIDHNPPLASGDNRIEIAIEDKEGKAVTDAKVTVNYYMPPMPRMPPMNYRTGAEMKKGKYYATMKFIMAGPWYIVIVIKHGGKTSTARINVDA